MPAVQGWLPDCIVTEGLGSIMVSFSVSGV